MQILHNTLALSDSNRIQQAEDDTKPVSGEREPIAKTQAEFSSGHLVS